MRRPKRQSPAKFKKRSFGNRRYKNCYICGKKLTLKEATVDHVRPRSKGGYDRNKNYRICCRDCNQSKADKTLGQHMMERQHENVSV